MKAIWIMESNFSLRQGVQIVACSLLKGIDCVEAGPSVMCGPQWPGLICHQTYLFIHWDLQDT